MDEELKSHLEGMENRIVERNQADLRASEIRIVERNQVDLTALENRIVEKMRDMQTELLRGFQAFSAVETVRLRKVESDQSNLDVALRSRVEILEGRLLQIELRLGLQ